MNPPTNKRWKTITCAAGLLLAADGTVLYAQANENAASHASERTAVKVGAPFIEWRSITFRLAIYTDGHVEYFDQSSKGEPKRYTKRLSGTQIRTLGEAFTREQFFRLNSRYDSAPVRGKDGVSGVLTISSMPGSLLKYSDGDRTKAVSYTIGAPPEVLTLEKQIVDLVGLDEWPSPKMKAK